MRLPTFRRLPAAALLSLCASAVPASDDPVSVDLHRMIPAPGGVSLAATIWKPADATEPLPSVLVLTPYVSDETHQRALKFARAGYAYVSVDVRGRGSSQGDYRPMWGHGPDGAAVADWVAGQPWSDGRIAMRGGSYRGMTQWQVMAAAPGRISAAIPTASAYPGHDFPNPDGILLSYAARWLAFTSGHTRNGNLFGDADHWTRRFVEHYRNHRPFAELAPLAGANEDVFLEWLQHPAYDDYWRAYNPKPAEYRAIDLPILTVTGYFDGDQPGAMRYYREHMEHGTASARERHYLLVGPWDHPGTRHPQREVGGLRFPENSILDMDQLQIDWLDWVLGEGERPALIEDRVNYYVMGDGADDWRHAPRLEAMADGTRKLYLSSPDGNPGSVVDSGRLTRQRPSSEPVDRYAYDPREVKDRDVLMEDRSDRYLADPLDAHWEDVLVYHSEPLDEPLTVAGVMRFVGNIALDVPDTDIAAQVQAVLPDGKTLVLGVDAIRARFRNGPEADFPGPGEVESYVFDGFYLTARRLPAGSRLRLVVFPLDSHHYLRNYNTGGELGLAPVRDARTANVSLQIGGERASYLELPLASGNQ